MPEIEVAYSTYAKTLGCAAMILSEKMSLQEFAKFVLETPVPKGHLDMTSLLFAPLEVCLKYMMRVLNKYIERN
jgi:hypothetical protein